jgi:hypothetical protein
MKPKWWQGSLFYILILVAILALAFSFLPTNKKPKEVDFYTFVAQVKQGVADTIQQDGTTLTGFKDDEKLRKIQEAGKGLTPKETRFR